MNVALSTWSFHPWLIEKKTTIEQVIDLMAASGIKGLEVVDIDFNEININILKRIKEYADSKGICISCLSLEHDLCQLTKEERALDVEKVIRWLDYAKQLEVNKVRVFTGWKKDGVSYGEQASWVLDGLKKIAQKAEELDVDLVLENHNSVILRADEILHMMKEINSPKLFTCPDVFNYARYEQEKNPIIGDEQYDEIKKLLPHAKNAHMKFVRFDENGEDVFIDAQRMIEMLKEAKYDGYIAIEFMWPFGEEDVDLFAEIPKAASLIEKYI